MQRLMLKSKIRRTTLTATKLQYTSTVALENLLLLQAIPYQINTLSVCRPKRNQCALSEDILSNNAKRVIFNLGTENSVLSLPLRKASVKVSETYTLILCKTDRLQAKSL